MKIIHVIQGTYWRGAEIFFFDLANELSRRGISQHIIILDGGSAPRLSFQGCSVSQLPSGRSLMQRILWLGTDIMKVSQAEAASVICHGQSPLKNVVYASFFGLLRFPPIITIKIGESLPWIKNLKTLRIKFNRILLKKADTIVALGEKQELELLNVFKVSPKLIKVIPNGRTPPDEAQNLSRTRQQNQILIVGALAPEKNHLLAFDVLSNVRKTYPDTRLVVLGDGPLRAFLKTRASQRFGSNVIEFKGHLNDVWPLFFESTLLLLCSKTEGLPGVLVEAA
ncbi:MAG: glycosyltransferase, partial [Pseudomonadota bacterium]|nr:glycosyltransferase [Pseudomonadota bacterium]